MSLSWKCADGLTVTILSLAVVLVLAVGAASAEPDPEEPQRSPAPAAQGTTDDAGVTTTPPEQAPDITPSPSRPVRGCIARSGPLRPMEPTGHWNPAGVKATLDGASADIGACFDTALIADPDQRGRVVVEITIARYGSVSSLEVVENSVRDRRLVDCLLETLGGLTFPPPAGNETTIEYAFTFDTL